MRTKRLVEFLAKTSDGFGPIEKFVNRPRKRVRGCVLAGEKHCERIAKDAFFRKRLAVLVATREH